MINTKKSFGCLWISFSSLFKKLVPNLRPVVIYTRFLCLLWCRMSNYQKSLLLSRPSTFWSRDYDKHQASLLNWTVRFNIILRKTSVDFGFLFCTRACFRVTDLSRCRLAPLCLLWNRMSFNWQKVLLSWLVDTLKPKLFTPSLLIYWITRFIAIYFEALGSFNPASTISWLVLKF